MVIEGRAQPIGHAPEAVIEAFQRKSTIGISTTDSEYNQVIEIEPKTNYERNVQPRHDAVRNTQYGVTHHDAI